MQRTAKIVCCAIGLFMLIVVASAVVKCQQKPTQLEVVSLTADGARELQDIRQQVATLTKRMQKLRNDEIARNKLDPSLGWTLDIQEGHLQRIVADSSPAPEAPKKKKGDD